MLFIISGVLWMSAGAVLCVRGIMWLREMEIHSGIAVGIGAILGGLAFYVFVFSGVVRKNIERISQLPRRPCIFAFTAARGYLMIGLMMATGFILRHSALPGVYLSLPYSAMGGVLLVGSARFYRSFFDGAGRKDL